MAPLRLSVCLITRNEAGRLPTCLASVSGLADEIVVVDTGSTDDTLSLARQAGARVVETAWSGDFSAARNVALQHARGAWILVLDADERLPEATRPALRSLVRAAPRRAYALTQRSVMPDGHHLDVAIVRLFPRDPRVRFERPVHEQVNTSLERAGIPIETTALVIEHDGYADPAQMPAKTRRNQALIAAALAADPGGDPHLRLFYAATFFDAGHYARAAEEYETCIRQCADARPKLAAMAAVKAAESHVRHGRDADAIGWLDRFSSAAEHPLGRWLRGDIHARGGAVAEAIATWEPLLAAADTAYLPPVPLGPLKLQVLARLAEAWMALGRRDIAVAVMRLTVALNQSGLPDPGAVVGDHYQRALTPAAVA